MTDIVLSSRIVRSPRVMQIEGMFDLTASDTSTTIISCNVPSLEQQHWNIGLIVGPSGSGKSTVARRMFGAAMKAAEDIAWDAQHAVVDEFPSKLSVRDVSELLSSVGFSSPPSWLRPFHTLSNGEQFRVGVARLLADENDVTVIDEFTSVVDRTVARVGSHAIAKAVRRRGQRFVAVSCHYDIVEWLQPDWIYEPASGEFRWEGLQRRPSVDVEIIRCTTSAWSYFSRHHYLSHELNKAAAVYVALIEDQPAALAGILPFPHPKLKNCWRISRIVVTPDFQGIGLGLHVINGLGAGYRHNAQLLDISTSHPAMIAALNRSSLWSLTRKPSRTVRSKSNAGFGTAAGRITASFRYCGPSDDRLGLLTLRGGR
jgi:energy-coupling factor transporter ATP-binding protein EcfA2